MWPFDLPVREALRLPGQTLVAWAVFDASWYRAAWRDAVDPLEDQSDEALLAYYLERGQQQGHSPNRFFDEEWHLRSYRGIQEAVRARRFASAFDAYCRTGNKDRSPHWLFDEVQYRRWHPDLTNEALAAGTLANGYDHYLRHGNKESRIGHHLFDPNFYLDRLDPDERAAAEVIGPYPHYLIQLERRAPERATSRYFDCAWYREQYPAVAEAIARGDWGSALEHYLCNDTPTVFDPLPDFSEDWYLTAHSGLRAVIEGGDYRNGYAHFLRHGRVELRSPARHIDLKWYAATNSVRESLARNEAEDAYAHWLSIGRPNGYPSAPPPEQHVNAAQARFLYQQAAEALLPLYGRSPIRFVCVGEPFVSVVMIVRDELAATLATLASLRNNTPADIDLILVVLGASPETGDIARFVIGATVQRLGEEIDSPTACVVGLAHARANAVLYLAGGLELAPGAIESALRRLETDLRIGAVGGKVLRPHGVLSAAGNIVWNDGTTQAYLHNESPLVPAANFVRDVHFCSCVFLLIRKDSLIRLGGFDGALTNGDDRAADLCLRLAEAGYRVVYDPGVMVRYWGDQVDGQNAARNAIVRPDKHAGFLARCHAPEEHAVVAARMADSALRHVLFIEDTVPLRGLGSGFVRSNDLIRAMAELGYAVTVFPVNGCRFGLASVYADMPDTVEVMHDRNLARLEEFLVNRRGIYDAIWIARTHNLDRVRSALEKVLAGNAAPPAIVLDTEAISTARDAARAALDGQPFDLTQAMRREFQNAHICRTIIAVSTQETEMLRRFGFPDVRTIGHMRSLHSTPRPFGQRSGLLFAGAIHVMDSPNYDSLCWFVDDVLPLVEQALGWETRLTIAGYTGPDVSLDRFRASPRVTLRGAVANMEPLYASHRVFVAPTRFAAGAPYKVHEAASFGLPVVATELLRQQLGWEDGQELLAAEATDAAGFAARIVTLYRDEALWNRLRAATQDRLGRENNEPDYAAAIVGVLGSARRDLPAKGG